MRFFLKNSGIIVLIFLSSTVYCQLNETSFAGKFNTYVNKALQEKIFIHTDKEFYVAGEILWFKVYYVNGTSHKALHLSKVVYVEVFNEKNEPFLQSKVSLKPGESNGSFYLPVSLSTGNYTLKAYTSWMRNFDEAYFFEKRITVVNTLKEPEDISEKDSLVTSINFFPEGGNLVSGIESRVGFNVISSNRGMNDCIGYIISNGTDTVLTFSPFKFGIGSFSFTPVSGNNYKAVVNLPGGKTVTKSLPFVYNNGYVMTITENRQQFIVSIKRKKMADEGDVSSVLLAAHTRQVLKIAERGSVNDNDSIRFIVDKNKLGNGVTHFTVFIENNKPVCERLVYIKPEQHVSANLELAAKEFNARQKIDLSLNLKGKSEGDFNLSASVFYADDLQKISPSNIVNYMWLSSDMPGFVESPDYYFSADSGVAIATDNLMLTHGWRKFNWDNVWKADNSFVKYLPEINGHLVTGQVIDSRSGRLVSGANTILSIPAYPFGLYSAESDSNGIVRFDIKNYYGNGTVIAQRGIGIDSFYTVTLLKPFHEMSSGIKQYPPHKLTEEVRQHVLLRSIGMQVQNIYIGDSMRNFTNPVVSDTLPFYGLSEKTYKLDDYKRFTTMEEVLREYVLEIGVTLRNGRPSLRIFNPQAHDFYDDYELVLLDGVMLRDVNKIFSYDPLKIKKLDIIQTRYILGQSVFNGVASFSTYDEKFDGYELDPKLIAIDYAGLQLQREFYSPVYETKEQLESRIPDFRSTLFWSPDITTNAEGKASFQFYSSDRPGTYMVVLQGMNENGEFVYSTTTFEIK